MFNTEQAFAVKVCMGLAVGGWFIFWSALQSPSQPIKRWLDVYLGTILGGILGARVFYVLLNLDFFLREPLNIPRLWFAELAWQGALIGGLLVMWGLCRWRDVPFSAFSDGMTLAFPVGFMAVCWASRSAGLLLGREAPNLDDLPVWMAAFLPDLNRNVAPRYELQMLGVGLGGILLLIAGMMTVMNLLSERRLWVVLLLTAFSVLILDSYSAYPQTRIFGLPLTQTSAVLLGLFSGGWLISQSVKRTESVATALREDRL